MRNSLVKLSAIVDTHISSAIREYGVPPELYGMPDTRKGPSWKSSFPKIQPLEPTTPDLIISTEPIRGTGVELLPPETDYPGKRGAYDRVVSRTKEMFHRHLHREMSAARPAPIVLVEAKPTLRGEWRHSAIESDIMRTGSLIETQCILLQKLYGSQILKLSLRDIKDLHLGKTLLNRAYDLGTDRGLTEGLTEEQVSQCVFIELAERVIAPQIIVLGVVNTLRLFTTEEKMYAVRELAKKGLL